MNSHSPVRRAFVRRGASAALISLAAPLVRAQTWPSQPLKFIVPFTPGTGADVLARLLGSKFSNSLGQPVVVDNRVGASGSIGTAAAAGATDGHTFLVTANTLVTNPHVQKHVSYDPIKQLVPVSKLAISSLALAVHPSFPAQHLREAVAVVKQNPGKFNYASPGAGTPQHLAMELLKYSEGLDILHVPYKGSAGAVTDLMAGIVQFMVFPLHFALPLRSDGKIRLLGVADPKRSSRASDVPTFSEQGVTKSNVDAWYAFLAPSATPPSVVTRLHGEIQKVLAMPDVVAALDAQGLTVATGTPADLGELMRSDYARWAELVRNAGITAE